MSSLWNSLLFMHGHIADPELARRLADTPPSTVHRDSKLQQVPKSSGTARRSATPPTTLAHGGCA